MNKTTLSIVAAVVIVIAFGAWYMYGKNPTDQSAQQNQETQQTAQTVEADSTDSITADLNNVIVDGNVNAEVQTTNSDIQAL